MVELIDGLDKILIVCDKFECGIDCGHCLQHFSDGLLIFAIMLHVEYLVEIIFLYLLHTKIYIMYV